MIKEDYVSRETYKLLKEKGYDGEFKTCYDTEGYTCPAIHFYDAMKWLRGVHGVHLAPFPDDVENGAVRYLPEILIISNGTQQLEYVEGLNICESYEQAAEAAIKYCMENLI